MERHDPTPIRPIGLLLSLCNPLLNLRNEPWVGIIHDTVWSPACGLEPPTCGRSAPSKSGLSLRRPPSEATRPRRPPGRARGGRGEGRRGGTHPGIFRPPKAFTVTVVSVFERLGRGDWCREGESLLPDVVPYKASRGVKHTETA